MIVQANALRTRFASSSGTDAIVYDRCGEMTRLNRRAGALNGFGGISGYDAKETSDESPERVAALQRITWAYLRTTLFPGDDAWDVVTQELATAENPTGRIESK